MGNWVSHFRGGNLVESDFFADSGEHLLCAPDERNLLFQRHVGAQTVKSICREGDAFTSSSAACLSG